MALFKHQKGEKVPVNKQAPTRMTRANDEWMDNFFAPLFNDDWDANSWPEMRKDWAPAINIHENENGYIVETELPGVDKSDISVDVQNNYLIINGEKNSFDENKKKDYHHVERTHGSFYRSIALPDDVDREKIVADLKDGVLSIEMGLCDKKASENRKINIR